MMPDSLSEMLQHSALWRGDHLAHSERPGLASGFAALDSALPGNGWPSAALTEILSDSQGIGELSLILPAIAAQTQQGHGVVLVNPPHWLYGPAWVAQGVVLAQCLVVRPECANDIVWVAEQSLRSGACALVVVWPEFKGYAPNYRVLRRLQIAADTGHSSGIVFRAERVAREASPAHLRLQLAAREHALCVSILKRRGAPLSQALLLAIRAPTQPLGELARTSCTTQTPADTTEPAATPRAHVVAR